MRRGWHAKEYCDTGISGSKDKRPALDMLVKDAKRRKFDVLVVWKMDRLGRSLRHLVTLLEELQSLGIAFVSLGEGIDATTPAGKLQMHILAAIAEFERGRIAERVRLGMARAKTQGKHLGRPRKSVTDDEIAGVARSAPPQSCRSVRCLQVVPARLAVVQKGRITRYRLGPEIDHFRPSETCPRRSSFRTEFQRPISPLMRAQPTNRYSDPYLDQYFEQSRKEREHESAQRRFDRYVREQEQLRRKQGNCHLCSSQY